MEDKIEKRNFRYCDEECEINELHDVTGELICDECFYS
jgi:hypothetical protein